MKNFALVLIFSFFAIASESANAQKGVTVIESIDCAVTNGDEVFIGTVKDYKVDKKTGLLSVEFGVDEVLKDFETFIDTDPLPPPTERDLLIRKTYAADLDQLKESKGRVLVCENKRGRSETSDEGHHTFFKIDSELPLVSADLQLLRDSDSVIRTAKQVIANAPIYAKRVHTFCLPGPKSMSAEMGTDLRVSVRVPTDQRLEKKALALLLSETPEERLTGLDAIRFFKSKENIEKVRGLLNDPYKKVSGSETKARFVVREAAWLTLQKWGVELEKPVLEE